MKRVLFAFYLLGFFTAPAQTAGILDIYPSTISDNGDTIRLSQQGILSDASLAINSSTFGIDQTAAIQSVIDAAPPGKIIKFDTKSSGIQFTFKGGITYYFAHTNGLI